MTSSEYFEKMRETCAVVNPHIMSAVEPLRQCSDGLYEAVSELPRKRTEASGQLRAFMLRNAYECSGGEDWERIAPICAAVELELCSMYYGNRVYDEKGEERNLAQISKSIMAAKITRDLASRLIERQVDVTVDDRRKILNLLNEADITFESGQHNDVFENTFSNRGDADFDTMIDFCETRMYGINASYLEKIGRMGGLLAGASEEETGALENFGRHFGMGYQIMNDVADFVFSSEGHTTSEKEASDTHRDIMHGKLTFPVIYTLHHGSEEEVSRLKTVFERGMQTPDRDLVHITRDMVNNGGIDFAIKEAKRFGRKARKQLGIFPKEKRRTLSQMHVVLDSNRYYKSLRKLKDVA